MRNGVKKKEKKTGRALKYFSCFFHRNISTVFKLLFGKHKSYTQCAVYKLANKNRFSSFIVV